MVALHGSDNGSVTSVPTRARTCAVATALALAGCGGDDEVRTVTVEGESRDRVAYTEVERQARKTCSVVPRDVLVDSFRRVSDDRRSYLGRRLTANDVALLYAEDVGMNPLPLQRAAYDGCLAGLKRQGR